MGIRVVALQVAVVEPQHALEAEEILEPRFDLLARKVAVAVGRQQALRRRQHRAGAVALNRAALEHESQAVDIASRENAALIHPARHQIVEVGREFQPPAVELEVVDLEAAVGGNGRYSAQVARPGIVGIGLDI